MPDAATTLLAIRDVGLPNLGVTLDFAHVLYADEQPAFAAALVARHSKLLGVHLNDGYAKRDDGLMVGAVHSLQTIELLRQIRRDGYAGAIYFDTFPDMTGLDPVHECEVNIATVKRMLRVVDRLDRDNRLFAHAIDRQDAVTSQAIIQEAMLGAGRHACRDEGTWMTLTSLDLKAVGPRIRMMMPHLTPLEAKVVETVFGRRGFDETIPLKQIAEEAGVSEAMVVKIAKKLGFSGYRDFRTAVYEYSRLPTAEMHRELSLDDSSAEIVQKVFRTSIHALEETLAILDMEDFDRAADLLYRARNRDFYGVGGSAQIARDVSHKFLRIGIRTNVYDDSHMMLMSASLLGADDIAVGFSHSGNTSAVIDAIQLAHKSGARTLAITNYDNSPLADVADIVLCSTAQGSPLMGENAAARIAQLNILDALFVAVAQRDYQVAERNLGRTMSAVTSKRKDKGHDATACHRVRQPALRHHGRGARPSAQGRDGDRPCLAPEMRRQGRQPGGRRRRAPGCARQ